MASALDRYKRQHAALLDKLDAAIIAAGPTYTVPGGATLNRMDYIKELRAALAELEKIPGVGGDDIRPTFEIFG